MNLVVTADHEPDDAAKAWLPGYVRSVFDEVVPYVRECCATFPDDPWDAFTGSLNVHIHPDGSWGLAGQYESLANEKGFHNPKVNDRIQISWDLEASSWPPPNGQGTRHAVLRHELQHFLAKQAGLIDGPFGHGHADDPYIQYIKRKLEFVYHGDVVMRHVSDVGVTL